MLSHLRDVLTKAGTRLAEQATRVWQSHFSWDRDVSGQEIISFVQERTYLGRRAEKEVRLHRR